MVSQAPGRAPLLAGSPLQAQLISRTDSSKPARRAKAGGPQEIGFETKTAIALGQLRQARDEGVPVGIVLGDAGYSCTARGW